MAKMMGLTPQNWMFLLLSNEKEQASCPNGKFPMLGRCIKRSPPPRTVKGIGIRTADCLLPTATSRDENAISWLLSHLPKFGCDDENARIVHVNYIF